MNSLDEVAIRSIRLDEEHVMHGVSFGVRGTKKHRDKEQCRPANLPFEIHFDLKKSVCLYTVDSVF